MRWVGGSNSGVVARFFYFGIFQIVELKYLFLLFKPIVETLEMNNSQRVSDSTVKIVGPSDVVLLKG